jgi:sulfhydrogenase subunit beta (sulfur reductase)
MNETYTLSQDHLRPFLRKLARTSELIAPVVNAQGDTLFQSVSSVDDVRLDLHGQTILSPKHLFLPQQETLFTYRVDETGYHFSEAAEDRKRTLFGIRACDLTAILYLDVVFQEGRKDNYYLRRRANTVLISLGCNEPHAKCFCNATRSGPFASFGYDLHFTAIGSRFLVEVGRVKGEQIIREWPQFFSPASDQDKREKYEVILEAKSRFHRLVHMDAAARRLRDGTVDDAVWQELSDRCQECGGCAFICPTCHCFSIVDKPVSANEGRRIRVWDACTLCGFTGIAGGLNTTPSNDKLKRRFTHKLLHDVEKHGHPSCVGCGRCVDICFGGVDMVSFTDMVCRDMAKGSI